MDPITIGTTALSIAPKIIELGKEIFGRKLSGIDTEHMANPFGVNKFAYGGRKYALGGEAENDEVIVGKDSYKKLKGKTHAEGGIQINPFSDSYIFSNKIGFDKNNNLTMGDDVKNSVADQVGKLKKNVLTDKIAGNTKKVYETMNDNVRNRIQALIQSSMNRYEYGGPYKLPDLNPDINKAMGYEGGLNAQLNSVSVPNFASPLSNPLMNKTLTPPQTSAPNLMSSVSASDITAPVLPNASDPVDTNSGNGNTLQSIAGLGEAALGTYSAIRGLFDKPRRPRPNKGAFRAEDIASRMQTSDQAAQNAITRGVTAARNTISTRSAPAYNANIQSLFANEAQARANASAQNQAARNQTLAQQAQQAFYSGRSLEATDRAYMANQMEQQKYLDQAFQMFYAGLKDKQNIHNQDIVNKLMVAALQQRNPNFTLKNYNELIKDPNNPFSARGFGV